MIVDNISALKTQQKLAAVRNAMDRLTMQDKLDVLLAAKTKLPDDERLFIEYLADDLIEAVKKRISVVRMSKAGALELLAALGVWISGRVQAEEQCPDCCGAGYIEMENIDYVSREMAMDAGDPLMEGQSIRLLEKFVCESCGGTGIIVTEDKK